MGVNTSQQMQRTRQVPPIIHGSSPFIGASQFGEKAYEYYKKFYNNPKLMAELFAYFSEKAYPWVHVIPYPTLIRAVELVRDEMELNVIITIDEIGQIDDISDLNPPYVFLHASLADSLSKRIIDKFVEKVKEIDSIPCIATHNPGEVIQRIESNFPEIEAYLSPLNPLGIYMSPNFELTLKALEMAKKNEKKIFGMKVLAAGKLNPEMAFRFAFKYCDSAIIGFVKKEEIDLAIEAIRKLKIL